MTADIVYLKIGSLIVQIRPLLTVGTKLEWSIYNIFRMNIT